MYDSCLEELSQQQVYIFSIWGAKWLGRVFHFLVSQSESPECKTPSFFSFIFLRVSACVVSFVNLILSSNIEVFF